MRGTSVVNTTKNDIGPRRERPAVRDLPPLLDPLLNPGGTCGGGLRKLALNLGGQGGRPGEKFPCGAMGPTGGGLRVVGFLEKV